ncbi:ribokinase [Kordia sp. SMS9]|uniref:ribokinase n=1 Tax=Kordia sp. SMS9 TaxID=2282170 RepID=UPI000E0D102D|nr:ribokinase [Kordia sp. SMS9]AXG69631.1 ribokinase [Kordia sp. SMS9]
MKAKLLIIGSVNQDIVVTTSKIPKAGETVLGKELFYFPGGKGLNQAVAAHKLEANVTFAGKVGEDVFGENMKFFMSTMKLNTRIDTLQNTNTGTAFITIDDTGENCITIIKGANNHFTKDDTNILENYGVGDFLLLQNEINEDINHEFIRSAFDKGMKVILNPAPAYTIPVELLEKCYCLIVNEHELMIVFGISQLNLNSEEELQKILTSLYLDKNINIIVTFGAKGVRAIFEGVYISEQGHSVEVTDTTGAGDCFCGAVVTFLAEEKNIKEAIALANKAAAISITGLGANSSYPSREDL